MEALAGWRGPKGMDVGEMHSPRRDRYKIDVTRLRDDDNDKVFRVDFES
jgi:hypothetical protein